MEVQLWGGFLVSEYSIISYAVYVLGSHKSLSGVLDLLPRSDHPPLVMCFDYHRSALWIVVSTNMYIFYSEQAS